MASSKGGNPGQWSAHKSQMLAKDYKKAMKKRGQKPYKSGKKSDKAKSIDDWGKAKWRTASKKPSRKTGEVYLPESKIKSLKATKEGRKKLAAANKAKRKATREGKQYSKHGLAAGTS